MAANLEQIVEQLSGLTVIEAAELSKKLEEKWGVSAAAPVAMSNREPWHWHMSVVPASSPPDSGHAWSAQVQRSSNA